MFNRWVEAVRSAMDGDCHGWGFADRYEAKGRDASHEGVLAKALAASGFRREAPAYPKTPSLRADGVVVHDGHPGERLRYEMKTVFLPHYHSAEHAHNGDFERLLRVEHPNGALGDIHRLRQSSDSLRVLLLLGVSWCDPDEPEKLALYEEHRDVLLDTFQRLARLASPSATHDIRGIDKPWSAVAKAWIIGT
jgi:hypothetical protein